MTPIGKIVFLFSIIYIYGVINLVPARVAAADVLDGNEQVSPFLSRTSNNMNWGHMQEQVWTFIWCLDFLQFALGTQ